MEYTNNQSQNIGQKLLNKVPEVTIYFWIIKVLCTTVGETASDFLNANLNLGLRGTSIITGILLATALFTQFKTKKYTPVIYWPNVVLISVFGTLVTDNFTDALHVPLEFSTILFSILLAITFAIWYVKEKTLSIHSIFTKQRELFYWLAVLFTFALGTASGDLMAESLGLGYALTGLIVCAVIFVFAVAWRLRLNSILAFWLIYIMTRPLGASLGDYLSQSKTHGGLGLGATNTSIIFVLAIIFTVIYLMITKRDATGHAEEESKQTPKSVLIQVIVVAITLTVVCISGYYWRQGVLKKEEVNSSINLNITFPTGSTTTPTLLSPLGDVSIFKTITQDTLSLVNANDISGATTRIADLEYEWDNAQARLKSMNLTKWKEVDGAIDKVLRELRSTNPNQQSSKSALETLLTVLNSK
jgi:uncharacterized membrane-anchored protein